MCVGFRCMCLSIYVCVCKCWRSCHQGWLPTLCKSCVCMHTHTHMFVSIYTYIDAIYAWVLWEFPAWWAHTQDTQSCTQKISRNQISRNCAIQKCYDWSNIFIICIMYPYSQGSSRQNCWAQVACCCSGRRAAQAGNVCMYVNLHVRLRRSKDVSYMRTWMYTCIHECIHACTYVYVDG